LWGWLQALVSGIVGPFVDAWQQYQHGRTAQQRDDAIEVVTVERKISDALQADERGRGDRDRALAELLRRELGPREAAGDGGAEPR
jgi:hypothetical protein